MSASHVAFASLRMEPVLMALGQAAGIAASLAAHRGLTVHNVPIRELKNKQDIYRTVADRAVVLDVSGAYRNGCITQRPPSSWTLASDMFGYIGRGYFTDGNTGKGKTLTFTPDITEPGSYRVYVKYPTSASVDADRSNAVPVTIRHAVGTTRLTLDQTSAGQGGDWDDLGVYLFDRGSPQIQTVTIETNGTDRPVVMSAVKLVKV
jgi:FAD dependent oxidoreductase